MIHTGDCIAILAGMEPDSIASIVADPPYGIGFMGHEWDQGGNFGAVSADHGGANVSYGGKPHPAMEAGRYDRSPNANQKFQLWCEAWATEALRVARPGAYMLVFGGTRTYHRLAAGIEDAGWEIRDCLVWAYAQGFPKSHNISKAIDKRLGATGTLGEPKSREHAGWIARGRMRGSEGHDGYQRPWMEDPDAVEANAREYIPGSPEAARWKGWGTALKPAWEPIVLAQKPVRGTIASNVLAHDAGALNIDGTRIPFASEADLAATMSELSGQRSWTAIETDNVVENAPAKPRAYNPTARKPSAVGDTPAAMGKGQEMGGTGSTFGRWPPNLLLTDPLFDGGAEGVVGGGPQDSSPSEILRRGATTGKGLGYGGGAEGYYQEVSGAVYGDAGTYSRFFLVPKADKGDREPILGGIEADFAPTMGNGIGGREHDPTDRRAYRANTHPTVKPIELMRHLVRLVTPPGGTVLDPFLGSGSTALAAEREGFAWVGIERDPKYVAIAEARLRGTQRGLGLIIPGEAVS